MSRFLPFVNEVFEHLRSGAILVTANKRLAREYRQQFNQLQLQDARLAWESAHILPFAAWVRSLWESLRVMESGPESSAIDSDHRLGDRVVIDAQQSRIIWQQIIGDDIEKYDNDTHPLWNIAATVKTAMSAWQISREWDISVEDCEKSFLPDHYRFARWARQFQNRCNDNNWIDYYPLIDEIIELLDTGNDLDLPRLIWAGFDSFTTQQQRLIDSLQKIGVPVSIRRATDCTQCPDPEYREYDSEYAQWLAAAYWVKEKMDKKSQQRIAIVAPALEKSRDLIDYALGQVLSPAHIINPGTSIQKPYHISLGKKLSELPVVEAAMLILSLAANRELQYSTISKAILCPFIAGADSEFHARSKLEYWCRRKLPFRVALASLLETLELAKTRPLTPVLTARLSSGCKMLNSFDEANLYSSWAESLLSWLDQFGWPGDRPLSSEEFQTVEAFRLEVSALRNLDLVTGPCSLATALSMLSQRLDEKPFEPESPGVNIEVLGVMESAGLDFDAIWFGGLTETDWPPPLHENPFIPHWLQLDASYHRTSISLNTEHARMQQSRLSRQCNEMVLSRHCFSSDIELLPSALFGPAGERNQSGPGLIEYFHSQRPLMGAFEDTRGLELVDGTARGGALVIQDQAACPFRAYARHRLGAREENSREPGLDALDRGSLIHKILQGIWTSLGSSGTLHSKTTDELKKIVSYNVSHCSNRFFHFSGSSKQFFRAQGEILEQLLQDWLVLEKSRNRAFIIVALETEMPLTLGKLTLSLKIDRIDELDDGSLALIDYKTGDTGSIRDWLGTRPKSPQLPLYALTQHFSTREDLQNPLSVIVFGQIRFGQIAYLGVSQEASFLLENQPSNRVTALVDTRLEEELKNWPALIAYWNDRLTSLADAYYGGMADVNPLDKSTCTYCDLHSFCRIYEATGSDE